MGNLGMMEVLVIAVVALLVFGPDRLPELARNAGKALARFRAESAKSVEELRRAADLGGLDTDVRSVVDEVRGIRDGVNAELRSLTSPQRSPTRPREITDVPPIDPEAT